MGFGSQVGGSGNEIWRLWVPSLGSLGVKSGALKSESGTLAQSLGAKLGALGA